MGHLEEAHRRFPRSTEVLNYLGEAYRRQGRPDLALETWRRSLELDPGQRQLREFVEREYPHGS